jgi:hypothetical protein
MVGLFAFWRLETQAKLPEKNVDFLRQEIAVVRHTHLPQRLMYQS